MHHRVQPSMQPASCCTCASSPSRPAAAMQPVASHCALPKRLAMPGTGVYAAVWQPPWSMFQRTWSINTGRTRELREHCELEKALESLLCDASSRDACVQLVLPLTQACMARQPPQALLVECMQRKYYRPVLFDMQAIMPSSSRSHWRDAPRAALSAIVTALVVAKGT